MRAAQVVTTTGPADVVVRDVEEPVPGEHDVLIDVHAFGVSFPDVLLSKGLYQLRPEPPFTIGIDVAGTVVSGPVDGSGFEPGQRVAAAVPYGGGGERAVAPAAWTFALPDNVSYQTGAAIPMNVLTAHFALLDRAGLREGETVLVHGAAGGVGTAVLQVAKGLRAQTIAVTSTPEKAAYARQAGADHAVLAAGFKEAVLELTNGRGVDIVVDVVGGEVFLDSLRLLAPFGRLLVVGFAAGQGIPEVKVNRLLLNNIDVRGVNWGGYAMASSDYMQRQWAALRPLLESGVVSPPIGSTYAFDDVARALLDIDERRGLGKSVVLVKGGGPRRSSARPGV
ncbi:NADPH:quinone oxidoreductase family protein [Nocardioides agariphilus]|jgi:NADPH2:quinone reductase|uniref:NADPH:quinone oxidoreductase family protein n=1 Tax=Nocardioides agariphilus TaxID=433664 RepID=A0A930VPK8_9ACTN|nr:NADPH:quinone oxidoreductase family protein [Nocardioides agariphilus]MBF4768486.1 NADPH:quinone oxidoreductase family protein [Nocardioides agariphilus]